MTEDESLAGSVDPPISPVLEEYRTARARLAELRVALRKEGYVHRPEIRAYLHLIVGLVRNFADAFEVFEEDNTPHPVLRAFLDDVLTAMHRSVLRMLPLGE